jgi:hypothetical protein
MTGARVLVDQAAQLGHRVAGIAQPIFVELDQRQTDAQVRLGAGVHGGAQILQLGRGGFRLTQRTGQQGGPAQGRFDPIGRLLGTLAIGLRRRLVLTPDYQGLDRGIPASGPVQTEVDQCPAETVDQRLENAAEHPDDEAVERPEDADQLERAGHHPGCPEHDGDHRSEQQDTRHEDSGERERILDREGVTVAGRPEERWGRQPPKRTDGQNRRQVDLSRGSP